jgi:hypothetical protein
MKLEIQNHAIKIPIDNSYIKFNNNKINSLQIGLYDTAKNYGIPHKVVQRLSQLNLKMSNRRHIKKRSQRFSFQIKLVVYV